ncbi:MAG TPA: M36 family metallopeptidase, partial [Polyangiaceae bacterium]|nr:M36 family metallopeptidase [Polyangiaceae bacterium]
GVTMRAEPRAKQVYFALPDRLVPAYYLELEATSGGDNEAYAYVVSAVDGSILYRSDLVAYDSYNYRVFADDEPARHYPPTDSPLADITPQAAPGDGGGPPVYAAPILVAQEGFNLFGDPWLPPNAPFTSGNNADAYADHDEGQPGGEQDNANPAGDPTAEPTAPGTFDYTSNPNAEPTSSPAQIKASVAQLFYTVNWLHDYYYDSGFDENAGVAQADNYGRAPDGDGDAMEAQAQDKFFAGARNNANMSTPADGAKPRMQMFAWGRFQNSGPELDGTHDNTIVGHEWGHYWHHRLVNCGGQQCSAMSEGWADFVALHMAVRDGDDLSGAFAAANYATSATKNASYFGIRRYPYSTDRNKNPLSFRHVATKNEVPIVGGPPINDDFVTENAAGEAVLVNNNSETHNAGEVWASILFDAYARLLAAHPFEVAQRRMADYVVGGMKLAPVEPTFTQQRDAILAYVYNADDVDFRRFVQAFAGRGMGAGAVSPPLSGGALVDPADPSSDASWDEAVEDSSDEGEIAFGAVELEEGVRSCDGDGVVDADETGQLAIRIDNTGMAEVDAAAVTVTTTTPGVTFANGGAATSAAIDPYGTLTVRVDATLAADVGAQAEIAFTVKAESGSSFTAAIDASLLRRTNYDEAEAKSKLDTVETELTPWTGGANEVSGSGGEPIWGRAPDLNAGAKINTVWHADDSGFQSDASIVTPDIVVAAAGAFTLTFNHRFSFETGPAEPEGPDVFWDGGVLEYAEVTGAGGELAWQDVTKLAGVNPGYTGKIGFPEAGNPLLDRDGYAGKSADFPALQARAVNFGTTLAGKTVRFRFRLGTDEAAGDYGWDIDNIAVTGATNLPFPLIVPDAGDCAGLPAVDAGADQDVAAGAAVALGATGTDPGGKALTYAWEQLEGPEVTLQGGDGAAPAFTAPRNYRPSTLVFRVKASNGGRGFAGDTVTVRVAGDPTVVTNDPVGSVGQCNPAAGSGGAAGGPGGSGAGGSNPGTAGSGGGGGDDDGCGCSTAGSNATRGAWLSALAAGLAFARRRRRRG